MQKWYRKNNKNKEKGPTNANSQVQQRNFAAIDLGTNSCRLVIATPTPAAFRIVETFSKITRLGEGIIKDNELSRPAIKRTVAALKVCAGVINEYAPIYRSRFVATAACRRAKNCSEFVELVKRDIQNHFATPLGSRVMLPAFGTRIYEMLFDPFDEYTKNAIIEDAITVIGAEPRAELVAIDAYRDEHALSLLITLLFKPEQVTDDLYVIFTLKDQASY